MFNSNPPSSQGTDEDDDMKAFHDQLKVIQGRLEKTAVVGESLQSTQHEIQLHLQALSSRSKDAYDAGEDSKAIELKKRIENLSQEADELTKESNLISRRTTGNDSDSEKVSDPWLNGFLFILFLQQLSNHNCIVTFRARLFSPSEAHQAITKF